MTIQPTLERPHGAGSGIQRIYRFDNGFGASVIQFTIMSGVGSYGAAEGLWELAVVRFDSEALDSFRVTYDTSITDDVIGHLNDDEVQALLVRIGDLPAANGGESR